MKKYNITYHRIQSGTPCVKSHCIVAKSEEKAIEGLKVWKGADIKIISIEYVGEFIPHPLMRIGL